MTPELPPPGARVVLTYGTFDLFHIGHLNLLRRLKALGDYLVVAVSTDEFNRRKGKETIIRFEDRLEIVQNVKFVDLAIPETCWEQKTEDVKRFGVSVFGMGDDWAGKFDFLKPHCEVVYLPRTANISSTAIKSSLRIYSREELDRIRSALGAGKDLPATTNAAHLSRDPTSENPPSASLDARPLRVLPTRRARLQGPIMGGRVETGVRGQIK